jgi:hypothetical protein
VTKPHVSWDIETMGVGSYGAPISLGAVKFDPNGQGVDVTPENTFYTPINLASSMKAGLRVDASTIEWWMDPKQAEARELRLSEPKVDLDEALLGFSAWYGDDDTVPVWGYGATFDNVILGNAYQALGIDKPWGYRADRCLRTLTSTVLPVVKRPKYGTGHHALDDAIAQAMWLQKIARLRFPWFME